MTVRSTGGAKLRAQEEAKRLGITFGDLCELVDQGREMEVDPSTPVTGDTWLAGKPAGRDGYKLKFLEV